MDDHSLCRVFAPMHGVDHFRGSLAITWSLRESQCRNWVPCEPSYARRPLRHDQITPCGAHCIKGHRESSFASSIAASTSNNPLNSGQGACCLRLNSTKGVLNGSTKFAFPTLRALSVTLWLVPEDPIMHDL